MSRQMIESFFPALTGLQQQPIPHLLSLLLPEDAAQRCPEPIISISGIIQLRRPFLAASAILGLTIGVGGSLWIWRNRMDEKKNDKKNLLLLWSLAFSFFGMMNISGLCLHCLVPAYENRKLVETYPTLWALDCFWTGLSSMCLIGAGLSHDVWCNRLVMSKYIVLLLEFPHRWIALTFLLATCSVGAFILFGVTSPLELWYLLGAATAAHVLLPVILLSSLPTGTTTQRLSGMAALLSGICLFPIGVLFDSRACYHLGGDAPFLDLLTAPTLLFFSCDVAFFGLFIWLVGTMSYASGKHDPDKLE